ncbi:MAG: AAA family ATPase [Myxococcota bacterium]
MVQNDQTLPPATPVTTLDGARGVIERLSARLTQAIVGRDEVIELVIVALLADGHVLLEDYPGSGKTTLAKALGGCIIDDNPDDEIAPIRRVQFTPDLLPSDVTGTTIFDPNANRFFFRPGPIFAHVLLADEINRTSPKVQAALLEAMAEKQTTIDNQTRKLDALFFVIATQNPLDLVGTFPLPAAQLDRFLFKIKMTHISRAAELDLLMRLDEIKRGPAEQLPRVARTEVLGARQVIGSQVHVARPILEALVDIADQTRRDERALQGVSTRSLVLMLPALQARAVARGRSYVSAADVEVLAPYIFSHRLMLAPGAGEPEAVVADCCRKPLETLARSTLRR